MDINQLPDLLAVRRSGDKYANRYAASAVVAAEIFDRLSQRLDYLSVEPGVVLDLGCGVATSIPILKKKYKKASLIGLDLSIGMLGQARRKKGLFTKLRLIQADAAKLPLHDESCDIVVSNLMLPQCSTPLEIFKEVNRVLKPGGAFLFSSLGPDSFKSIIDVQNKADPGSIRSGFPDMHDLGDFMANAGMAQPVLDVEYLDVSYTSVDDMLQELRICGASNLAVGRRKGLMSKSLLKKIYASINNFENLSFSLEIIQGHAWKGNVGGLSSLTDASIYPKIKIMPISSS